ncbi:MAG TPA: hypothetical protein VMU48_18900, partial [Terracidiphilus sp.]|nr:hypothetical protein [Terracidiphilus sp.]
YQVNGFCFMFFRAPKDLPPFDLLANLRAALLRLESDPNPTQSMENLRRILIQRISILESEVKNN